MRGGGSGRSVHQVLLIETKRPRVRLAIKRPVGEVRNAHADPFLKAQERPAVPGGISEPPDQARGHWAGFASKCGRIRVF